LTTDDTEFPDKKASYLCNLWLLSSKREFTIRLLSAQDGQYLHFVSLSINQIEVEALAILREYDRKPLKVSKPFQD